MNINKLALKLESFKQKLKRHSYIQMTDNSEVIIDTCKSVLQYDENLIRIQLTKNFLTIIGSGLQMSNFSADGVEIKGEINSFKFENTEKTE